MTFQTSVTEFAVSTHSHPKVAAQLNGDRRSVTYVSTHSHPKVAAKGAIGSNRLAYVSTHSHPKVAASRFSRSFDL